jgi:hypothetical protein
MPHARIIPSPHLVLSSLKLRHTLHAVPRQSRGSKPARRSTGCRVGVRFDCREPWKVARIRRLNGELVRQPIGDRRGRGMGERAVERGEEMRLASRGWGGAAKILGRSETSQHDMMTRVRGGKTREGIASSGEMLLPVAAGGFGGEIGAARADNAPIFLSSLSGAVARADKAPFFFSSLNGAVERGAAEAEPSSAWLWATTLRSSRSSSC